MPRSFRGLRPNITSVLWRVRVGSLAGKGRSSGPAAKGRASHVSPELSIFYGESMRLRRHIPRIAQLACRPRSPVGHSSMSTSRAQTDKLAVRFSPQTNQGWSPCPRHERRVRSAAAAVPTSWTSLTFCIHRDSITSDAAHAVAGGWCPRRQTNRQPALCWAIR